MAIASALLKNMKFMNRNSFPLSNASAEQSVAATSSPGTEQTAQSISSFPSPLPPSSLQPSSLQPSPLQPSLALPSQPSEQTHGTLQLSLAPSFLTHTTLHGRKSFQNYNKPYERKYLDNPSLLTPFIPSKSDDMPVLEKGDYEEEDVRRFESKKDRKSSTKNARLAQNGMAGKRKSDGLEGGFKDAKHAKVKQEKKVKQQYTPKH